MTTDNRRKEEESKAKTEESRENLVPLANSAVVDKAERKTQLKKLRTVGKGHGEWPELLGCIE